MEIRMRSAVSRTAKGYSIEATLDMGGEFEEVAPDGPTSHAAVILLSAFQIAKLKEHLDKLGAVFPREE